MWAQAAERERLLVETIEDEESRQRSAGEICREQRAVFVIHSQEAKEALEGLSGEGVRLARVIPAEDVCRGGGDWRAPGSFSSDVCSEAEAWVFTELNSVLIYLTTNQCEVHFRALLASCAQEVRLREGRR